MGQVTLPILNRKGYSSVWENQWDTKLNFTKNLNSDMFLKKFFKIFLKNWFSSNDVFFSRKFDFKKSLSFKKIRYKKYSVYQHEYGSTRNYLLKFKNKKFTYNFSKLFLIRFQKWVILYVYIYVPQVWINRLEKKKIPFFNKNYIDDLYKYQTAKLNFLNNK